jgi:metal-dependent amidase/aminoacylase/carboxypeptidase family protein
MIKHGSSRDYPNLAIITSEWRSNVYPHHHPRFNIEEDALPVGVEVLTRAAVDFLNHS